MTRFDCSNKMALFKTVSISWVIVFVYFVDFINCHDVYMVDNSQEMGRRYEGIGGLSGGGATSKLLVNYPQEQRDHILDYLFKPGFGAALSMLKVEIGGDAQSTDGTEASHMHYRWDENYQRGYEWWLMVEAKKRNPDILLYCLPWAFPAWVGNGTRSPYHDIEQTSDYVIKFINGAWIHYKLRMNYVGIWNERNYDAKYIKLLRKKLDMANFTDVQIVASDSLWEPISENILLDEELADAVFAIGTHYPGTKSSENAVKTGKSLWASEDYSTYNDNIGAGCWARILNQNYVVGNMTSTISWNLIASYYDALPFSRDGLMTAISPWSGHYRVESPIWMTAHTTWFTSPGWNYFGHGSGVSLLKEGGSIVSLESFNSTQLTMVIETMSHDHSKCIRPALPPYEVYPQNITIQLSGSFAQLFELNVWYSKLGFDGEDSVLMKNSGKIPVIKGAVSLSLGVDEMFTLTTLQMDPRGNEPTIPDIQPFPLPYTDDFEKYQEFQEPFNLAQQIGAYEVINTRTTHGNVIRQMVLDYPCAWCDAEKVQSSLNVVGNFSWSNIYAQIDTRVGTVNATSGVFVASRVNKGGCSSFEAEGIYFFLFPKDGYIEVTGDLARTQRHLKKSVSVTADGWNTLGLLLKDGYASGMLNNEQVFNISLPGRTPPSGFVALGTAEYGLADFDNLKIASSADGQSLFEGVKDVSLQTSNFNREDGLHDTQLTEDEDTLYFKPHENAGNNP